MAEKKQRKRFASPKGIAKYPWLNTPSTAFNKNEYKTGLLLKAGEETTEKFLEFLNGLVNESYAEAVENLKKEGKAAAAKQVQKRYPYKEELDKETGEETGFIELNFTTQAVSKEGKPRKVRLFDAKGESINPDDVKIAGGSVIKVNFTPSNYYMAASREAGVKLYLNAVQVIDLVEFGGGTASDFGFEEEEGYAYEANTAEDMGEDLGGDNEEF
jgi:hypothetical protein